jgi:hypothetical protein
MTKSEATCQVDAVDVGEVRLRFMTANMGGQAFAAMEASADYALVVSETGTRVGRGTCSSWSEATQQKVRELLAAMEADICVAVFGKAPQAVDGAVQDTPHSDGVPGL